MVAVVGDLVAMPFCSASFALVFNSSTVEHLNQPGEAVTEMQRVCAPHGRVFVGVPYSYGPLAFQPILRRTQLGRWLGPLFSRRTLADLFQSAGLTPRTWIRYFFQVFVGAVAVKNTMHAHSTGPQNP